MKIHMLNFFFIFMLVDREKKKRDNHKMEVVIRKGEIVIMKVK